MQQEEDDEAERIKEKNIVVHILPSAMARLKLVQRFESCEYL